MGKPSISPYSAQYQRGEKYRYSGCPVSWVGTLRLSPPVQVLTKDSVTVSVDAVVYYRVSNATVSVANVENAHHSTRLLAQTTLRNMLGTKNLHEILSDRSAGRSQEARRNTLFYSSNRFKNVVSNSL